MKYFSSMVAAIIFVVVAGKALFWGSVFAVGFAQEAERKAEKERLQQERAEALAKDGRREYVAGDAKLYGSKPDPFTGETTYGIAYLPFEQNVDWKYETDLEWTAMLQCTAGEAKLSLATPGIAHYFVDKVYDFPGAYGKIQGHKRKHQQFYSSNSFPMTISYRIDEGEVKELTTSYTVPEDMHWHFGMFDVMRSQSHEGGMGGYYPNGREYKVEENIVVELPVGMLDDLLNGKVMAIGVPEANIWHKVKLKVNDQNEKTMAAAHAACKGSVG